MANEALQNLHRQAVLAREHSHSPYSQAKVGASILLENGEVFSGCNIENASFGGTVCAERVALWKAVSEKGLLEIQRHKITDIMVVTDSEEPWPPCGFCRQVMAEFCGPETQIHTANLKESKKTYRLKDLFPESFTPRHLKK
jgi:cytidine deaminase